MSEARDLALRIHMILTLKEYPHLGDLSLDSFVKLQVDFSAQETEYIARAERILEWAAGEGTDADAEPT